PIDLRSGCLFTLDSARPPGPGPESGPVPRVVPVPDVNLAALRAPSPSAACSRARPGLARSGNPVKPDLKNETVLIILYLATSPSLGTLGKTQGGLRPKGPGWRKDSPRGDFRPGGGEGRTTPTASPRLIKAAAPVHPGRRHRGCH